MIGVVDSVAKGCRKVLALDDAPEVWQQVNYELSDFTSLSGHLSMFAGNRKYSNLGHTTTRSVF